MRIDFLRTLPAGIGILFFLHLLCPDAWAERQWRTKADVTVAGPGIVEALLPPELVETNKEGQTDLILVGPDQQQRAFELYWREPTGEINRAMTPDYIRLEDETTLVWEAGVPENLIVSALDVRITEKSYIGKIDILGFQNGLWIELVDNAAVFEVNNSGQVRISVPESHYEKIQIRMKGYDKQIRESLIPLDTVYLTGKKPGKDFAEHPISLNFETSPSEDGVVLDAVLPGEGLKIKSISVTTEAQFQGDWEIGREIISAGRKQFISIRKGEFPFISRQSQAILLDEPWEGRSLTVKLHNEDRFIGRVKELTAVVILPRLVFAADRAGAYTVFAGTGRPSPILDFPGDLDRLPDQSPAFGAAEANPNLRLSSLLEKYTSKGGPFDPGGYAWKSLLPISEPGYYRFSLNLEASLGAHQKSIRIVKNGLQLPYLQGRVQTSDLVLAAQPAFDAEKNRTVWEIELPMPSAQWRELVMDSRGVFRREMRFLIPGPGNMGRKPWHTAVWENRSVDETSFHLNLADFPEDQHKIHLEMDHGDNQPVDIARIQARYASPTLYFLAHESGPYTVYGGNPAAAVPIYDLSLIEKELLSALSTEIEMGDSEPLKTTAWKHRFFAAFKDSGKGLYVVLGLATLAMIVVVIRLFPKS